MLLTTKPTSKLITLTPLHIYYNINEADGNTASQSVRCSLGRRQAVNWTCRPRQSSFEVTGAYCWHHLVAMLGGWAGWSHARCGCVLKGDAAKLLSCV